MYPARRTVGDTRRRQRRPGQSEHERGCPRCGHDDASVGSVSTTGSGLSKMFDVQTNTFRTVTCTNCGYAERDADSTSSGSDLIDVFWGETRERHVRRFAAEVDPTVRASARKIFIEPRTIFSPKAEVRSDAIGGEFRQR